MLFVVLIDRCKKSETFLHNLRTLSEFCRCISAAADAFFNVTVIWIWLHHENVASFEVIFISTDLFIFYSIFFKFRRKQNFPKHTNLNRSSVSSRRDVSRALCFKLLTAKHIILYMQVVFHDCCLYMLIFSMDSQKFT